MEKIDELIEYLTEIKVDENINIVNFEWERVSVPYNVNDCTGAVKFKPSNKSSISFDIIDNNIVKPDDREYFIEVFENKEELDKFIEKEMVEEVKGFKRIKECILIKQYGDIRIYKFILFSNI
jgi:hypothetical protein